MKNKKIISGIDIGTTKIAVIIAEIDQENEINIIGFGESNSNVLRRGIVVDIESTVKSLEKAVNLAEEQAGFEIESAYVGLTGEHIKAISCSGAITISNSEYMNPEGDIIKTEHIEKVLKHAQAIRMAPDSKILHTISKKYKVDDRDKIKNPKGLSGHRLEANVLLVTIQRSIERDLKTCLKDIGIRFDGFVLEPIASSYSVLDNDERNLGVALIDIGGGTSDIIIFYENAIIHTAAIPLGGESITKDIAYALNTSIKQAEIVKCKYGISKASLANSYIEITIKGTNGRDDILTNQKELSEIIEARMHEIFILAKNEINTHQDASNINLNFGIVLTGGGSQLTNISDLGNEIFQLDTKIGKPNSINGLNDIIENPRYSTTIGLIKYALENNEIEINDEDDSMFNSIKEIFKKLKNKIN